MYCGCKANSDLMAHHSCRSDWPAIAESWPPYRSAWYRQAGPSASVWFGAPANMEIAAICAVACSAGRFGTRQDPNLGEPMIAALAGHGDQHLTLAVYFTDLGHRRLPHGRSWLRRVLRRCRQITPRLPQRRSEDRPQHHPTALCRRDRGATTSQTMRGAPPARGDLE